MFIVLRQFRRFMEIVGALLYFRVDRLIVYSYPLNLIRLCMKLHPRYCKPLPTGDPGEALRMALEQLGPIFIKLGQLLSTRADFVPDSILKALVKLQDRVPAFSPQEVLKAIEAAYGCSAKELFLAFDTQALASASIAQVHSATLKDGTDVVVKLLRPRVKQMIRQDLSLLYRLARWLECLYPASHRLHPIAIVEELDRCLANELDLLIEAANARKLKEHFSDAKTGLDHVYIPVVYWEYARSSALVFERIYGIPIYQLDALEDAKIDLKWLAQTVIQSFFVQAFEHSFFHADMHPGNLFVLPDRSERPGQPKLVLVDFGIVGVLNPIDQRYLAENLLAFFRRDYYQVALLHIESGWVPADTRIDVFESAIRSVCEPIFAQSLDKISLSLLLTRLIQTAKRFEMEVLPPLLLLQKTLLNVESLARYLQPNLDLWGTVQPLIENWMRRRMGWRGGWRMLRRQLPYWLEKAPELPSLIYHYLKQSQTPDFFSPFPLQYRTHTKLKMLTEAEHFIQLARKKRIHFLKGLLLGILLGIGALRLLF